MSNKIHLRDNYTGTLRHIHFENGVSERELSPGEVDLFTGIGFTFDVLPDDKATLQNELAELKRDHLKLQMEYDDLVKAYDKLKKKAA